MAIMLSLYSTIYLICKFYLNSDSVKKYITARASEKLDRELTIGSDIDFSVSWDMTPHVHLGNVTLSNIKGSSQPYMLSVENLELNIDLIELLFKEIKITGLKLIKPTIYLESNNNINNWDFPLLQSNPEKPSKDNVTITSIEIEDGHLTFTKNGTPADVLKINHLFVESNDTNTNYDGKLTGTLNNIALSTAAIVIANDSELEIKVKNLQYGDTDFAGKLVFEHDPKKITADFTTKELDLETLANSSNSSASGTYTISNAPVPVDILKNNKIRINYTVDNLKLNNLQLKNVVFLIKSKDNVISAALDKPLRFAGGELDLKLNYDVNNSNPPLKVDFNASNLQLDTLFTEISGKTPITGSTLNITTNLQSNGATYSGLVNNLNGKILATAGPGEYLNSNASVANVFSNVLSAMITFNKNQNTTKFSCAVLNFKVNNGVANANKGVALDAASVHVLGNGTVDLRNGRINFNIVPKNITNLTSIDLSQFSMAQAISVQGTISKPQVTFNPVNLISTSNVVAAAVTAQFLVPLGIATAAKDIIDPSSEKPISPCKIALEQ